MSRRKGTKQKLPPGKFLNTPVALLKEIAGKVSAVELRAFLAVCAQSQPWSNGTAKLCRSVISEFHLGSQRDVTAATKKLLEFGYIVRTRPSAQKRAALYAVTYLPINGDAVAKANGHGSNDGSSASNSGSAGVLPLWKRKRYQGGSVEPQNDASALPPWKRVGPFSTNSALPPWNTSKNLPDASGISGAVSAPDSDPLQFPLPAARSHALAASEREVPAGSLTRETTRNVSPDQKTATGGAQ